MLECQRITGIKAKEACVNVGENTNYHFPDVKKTIEQRLLVFERVKNEKLFKI